MVAPSLVVSLVEVPLVEISNDLRVDMTRMMIKSATRRINVVVEEELAPRSTAAMLDRLKVLLEVHSSYVRTVSV